MNQTPLDAPRSSSLLRNPWLLGGLAALMVLLGVGCLAGLVVGGYLAARPQAEASQPVARVEAIEGDAGRLGRLVVVAPDGGLQTLNPDGSDARMLAAPGLVFQFPAWSPDGRRIAAPGNDGSEGGVWVLEDAVDPKPVAVYRSQNRAPFYLYWSPDSRWLSFLANDMPGLGLWLAEPGGASSARKVKTGQPFYWEWEQTNDQMFIHTGGIGPSSLLTFIDLEGADLTSEIASPGPFQAPGISASGRYIAFAEASTAGASAVVIDDRSQAGVHQSVPHQGFVAMTWSPTADQLAFISPPVSAPHFFGPLHLLDAADGQARTLSSRTIVAFFWSPDGKTIAFLSPASDESGARAPALRPASGHAQANDPLLDLWLIDVASGEERRLASFQPSLIFVAQFLPFFDQYALSHRLWSPASDALALPVREADGSERIYIFSLDGTSPRPLADGVMSSWSWQ